MVGEDSICKEETNCEEKNLCGENQIYSSSTAFNKDCFGTMHIRFGKGNGISKKILHFYAFLEKYNKITMQKGCGCKPGFVLTERRGRCVKQDDCHLYL